MVERNVHNLDQFRFAPSVESLGYMQELKHWLPELQKTFPEIKGFGFFGSRTLGTDKPTSDLDTFVFYNSHDIPPEEPLPRVPLSTLHRPKTERMVELEKVLRAELAQNNLEKSSLIAVDISPEMTQAYLVALIEAVENGEIEDNPIHNRLDKGRAYMAILMSRFHLAVGHEVYQNRKQVLDYLERMPNGERYFNVLMNHLAHTERFKHSHTGKPPLPKTIAEARDYFLTE